MTRYSTIIVTTLSNFNLTCSVDVCSSVKTSLTKTKTYPKKITNTSTLLTILLKVHTVSQLSDNKGAVMWRKKTNQIITIYTIIDTEVVVEYNHNVISLDIILPNIALTELSNITDNIEIDNTKIEYKLKSVISNIGSSSKNKNTTSATLKNNFVKVCIYNILIMSIIGIEPICFSTWRLQRHPFPFWHIPKTPAIVQTFYARL